MNIFDRIFQSAAVSAMREELARKDRDIRDLSEELSCMKQLARFRKCKIDKLLGDIPSQPPVPPIRPPRTNGGKIRSMTDEELCIFLCHVQYPHRTYRDDIVHETQSDWLRWLESAAEEYIAEIGKPSGADRASLKGDGDES